MATIDDIGTPGAPLSDPPLTEWQAAVRDQFRADRPAASGASSAISWPSSGYTPLDQIAPDWLYGGFTVGLSGFIVPRPGLYLVSTTFQWSWGGDAGLHSADIILPMVVGDIVAPGAWGLSPTRLEHSVFVSGVNKPTLSDFQGFGELPTQVQAIQFGIALLN